MESTNNKDTLYPIISNEYYTIKKDLINKLFIVTTTATKTAKISRTTAPTAVRTTAATVRTTATTMTSTYYLKYNLFRQKRFQAARKREQ